MTPAAADRELRDRLLAGDDPLVSLLIHGDGIAPDGLPPTLLTHLRSSGLADVVDGRLVPLAEADVWSGHVVLHDIDVPGRVERETVLGVNNTTRALAACTPRTHVARALDLATGPGGLALLLADHADVVVATDLSERACGYARRNVALNEVSHVDVRQGDLFDPVAGDAPFDLITANLPFVVSPDHAFTFRDGGHERDELCRLVIGSASGHLAPGGIAVANVNWLVAPGADPGSVPLGWVTGSELDAVVLHHSVQSPIEYAERWNRSLLADDPAAYALAIERWGAAFAEWGAEGVAYGTVAVRRPTGRREPVRVVAAMRARPDGDGGSQLVRILDNGAWLADRDDADLLRAAPRLCGPHRLDQSMRYDGSWSALPGRMTLDDTVGVVADVEPLATHVVLRLDGASTVADLVAVSADATGLPRDELAAAAVRVTRELLRTGCATLDT